MVSSHHRFVGFVGVLLFGVICCFQWDPLPDPVLYPCVGKGVTFPWGFKTDLGERVVDIHWVFDGVFSSQLIATMTHEYFLPTQPYSKRARHVENGGFSLREVTLADSGNYSVEINVLDKDGSFSTNTHAVYLQVADGLMTQGRKLTVEQDPIALWDNTTQQYVIRLNCGRFTYLGQPPIHVIWTNSKGETQSSTGYDSNNNNFFLALSTPVHGGNFSCHIPPHLLPDACVTDLGGDGDDTVRAGVTVDELKARLTLIEAEQKMLKKKNAKLEEDNAKLKEDLKEQVARVEERRTDDASEFMDHISNLTDHIEDTKITCDRQIQTLHSVQQSIQDDVQSLNSLTTGPCASYRYTVFDDITRSVDHGDGGKCDNNLISGSWYRFLLNGTNAVIPTSCVQKYHCDTDVSVWIDLQGAALPKVGHDQVARVCGSWSGSCCNSGWRSPATVRNCGDFFLYKLTTMTSCSHRFCAERQN